jgi:hypothetical protein
MPYAKTIAAGLLAAVILACSDGAMESIGQMMVDAGNELAGRGGVAAAQSGGCAQWEVRLYLPTEEENEYCEAGPCSPPAGWEPFSNHGNFLSGLWMRRCAR